jgi:branched-chain amino acid transport system permease protein
MTGKDLLPILGFAALAALVPLVVTAGTWLNFAVFTLIICLAAQGWNILGGYGGQYSFGHAAFFGTAAYVTAILQTRYGVNPYLGFALGTVAAAAVGAVIGALSFRSGLRGSYFALVTLAFAEVFRVLANASPATGGAAGVLIPLDVRVANFQFESRAIFYWIALGLVVVALVVTRAMERSRLGAQLVAVRENEDAARALGVDALRVKLSAIALSAAITGAAGALYAQYFLYLDSTIAYGPWISVEALLAPIIGGAGTVFGPIIGGVLLHSLSEFSKTLVGRIPGLDVAVFGVLLILVVRFPPSRLPGLLRRRTR